MSSPPLSPGKVAITADQAAILLMRLKRLPEAFEIVEDPEEPAQSRLLPNTFAALACTEYTRDGGCGCNGRRCNRSGELVTWQECLDCKASESDQGNG